MSVVIFDGRYLCGDTIGVTAIGMVDPTQKVVQITKKVFAGFVGNITAARVIIAAASKHFKYTASHIGNRVDLLTYPEQVVHLPECDDVQGENLFDYCNVVIIDMASQTKWYNSLLHGKVYLVGEPLAPFVLGGETTRMLGMESIDDITREWQWVEGGTTDLRNNISVQAVERIVRLSDSRHIASKFAMYPLHVYDCNEEELVKETWLQAPETSFIA